MAKYFYYVREFSGKGQMNDLDFVQRMLVSAEVTRKLTSDPRDPVEIIFNFDGTNDINVYKEWNCYKEYVKADSDMKQAGLAKYYTYALDHVKSLHCVKIDIAALNIIGKNCLSTIAFKMFVIAASQHKVNDNNDWFSIRLYSWKKSARRQKARTIKEIEEFLEDQQIYAQLDRANNLKVFSKRIQEERKAMKSPVFLERPVKSAEQK